MSNLQPQSTHQSKPDTDPIAKFLDFIVDLIGVTIDKTMDFIAWSIDYCMDALGVFFEDKLWKNKSFLITSACNIILTFILFYFFKVHLELIHIQWPTFLESHYGRILYENYNILKHTYIAMGVTQLFVVLGFTTPQILTARRTKDAFDQIDWGKTKPKISSIRRLGRKKMVLTVQMNYLGLDKIRAKEQSLEAALNMEVSNMKVSPQNRDYVTIAFVKEPLQEHYDYGVFSPYLKHHFCFPVGMSDTGIVWQNIMELPHMLVSGATGGGKSVFLNQVFISLLKVSGPHIKLHLIDMKEGLETVEYSDLDNVEIAGSEVEAVEMLRAIKVEVKRRYEYLKQRRRKKVDPVKDKMPLLVIAVDEATVLYDIGSAPSHSSSDLKRRHELLCETRDITNYLGAVARAAGVSLILSTQKVIKSTIDTKVRDNLGGRLSFKAESREASRTVLGNNMAYELDAIKGRAIWKKGSQYVEVQTPFLSDFDRNDVIGELIMQQHDKAPIRPEEPKMSLPKKLEVRDLDDQM